MQLAFSNSSINTPAANMIARVSHYMFMHVSTVKYLLNVEYFRKLLYNRESFPVNNKDHATTKLFHHKDLHYTAYR